MVIEFLRDDSLSIRIETAMKERVELFGEAIAEVFHADWEVMDFKIHKKHRVSQDYLLVNTDHVCAQHC